MRRHDTARHSLSDAERIADGQHQITNFDFVGIAETQHWKLVLGFNFQHGKVCGFIAQKQLAFELATVRQGDFDFVGILDDVIVRHDNA